MTTIFYDPEDLCSHVVFELGTLVTIRDSRFLVFCVIEFDLVLWFKVNTFHSSKPHGFSLF